MATDPFLTAQPQGATPDAGQTVASAAPSAVEQTTEEAVVTAEEVFSAFMPQFSALAKVSLPLALCGVHLGFAFAHLLHHVGGAGQSAIANAVTGIPVAAK